jgi:hypothetical protein
VTVRESGETGEKREKRHIGKGVRGKRQGFSRDRGKERTTNMACAVHFSGSVTKSTSSQLRKEGMILKALGTLPLV